MKEQFYIKRKRALDLRARVYDCYSLLTTIRKTNSQIGAIIEAEEIVFLNVI
jgi:hypothetical protein